MSQEAAKESAGESAEPRKVESAVWSAVEEDGAVIGAIGGVPGGGGALSLLRQLVLEPRRRLGLLAELDLNLFSSKGGCGAMQKQSEGGTATHSHTLQLHGSAAGAPSSSVEDEEERLLEGFL